MPHPTVPPNHAAHDPLLVAAYAAGDARGRQLDEAAALVAGCHDCAALHRDLREIAMALPATAATAPSRRPRDFRLTADQAAALRPSGWRRLLAPFAGPSFAFARPLGTGLATLGLAGILVAGAAGIPLGGAASAPAEDTAASAPMAAGEASPETVEKQEAPAAAATMAPAPVAMQAPESAAPGSADPAVAMPMAIPEPSGDPAFAVGVAGGAGSGAAGAASAAPGGATPGGAESSGTGGMNAEADQDQPVARAAQPAEDGAGETAPASPVPLVGLVSLLALVAGLALLGLRLAARRA